MASRTLFVSTSDSQTICKFTTFLRQIKKVCLQGHSSIYFTPFRDKLARRNFLSHCGHRGFNFYTLLLGVSCGGGAREK